MMTCEETINELGNLFPSPIKFESGRSDKHKDQFLWRPTRTGQILEIAESILPYSVTKKKQLTFLVAICKRKMAHQRGVRVTDPFYLAMCESLAKMNKRGPQ